MNTQMIICMVIFVATLISYMLNKIPMWLTAMISMAALYITGCIDDAGALSGLSNVNTLLMACMFIVAAGGTVRQNWKQPYAVHVPHYGRLCGLLRYPSAGNLYPDGGSVHWFYGNLWLYWNERPSH